MPSIIARLNIIKEIIFIRYFTTTALETDIWTKILNHQKLRWPLKCLSDNRSGETRYIIGMKIFEKNKTRTISYVVERNQDNFLL